VPSPGAVLACLTSKAKSANSGFLDLWKDADSNLRLHTVAAREFAALGHSGAERGLPLAAIALPKD
jgi:hypothetical protein